MTVLDILVKLPRSPNVDDVLKKYLEYRTRKDGTITDSIAEILNGLRCYFDKALPLMLLYKKERQQYHDAVTNNASPSTIYGAEHLLRLFVKLPELLAYVNMEEETLTRRIKALSLSLPMMAPRLWMELVKEKIAELVCLQKGQQPKLRRFGRLIYTLMNFSIDDVTAFIVARNL
ncbi:hypothetical protein Cgig2_011098 [Carnegiea gigantea]|uniref:MRG domain-containing protein n=1 Tax=Carnegiea gigantea TaxID=171969 RepID=A0A9Q1JH92_9CARY|nr:hypothetical protein Cgig2_011098 [Carnegiea gigantea]